MSEEKKSDSSNSKALLYSELLGTSVAGHAQELLQKKKKSCTYHVERSSVLERVSKLFHLIDEGGTDEENIEIVEEGKPYIDMSVSLIEREDGSEYGSEDSEDDLENGIEDTTIISCSDTDSELSEDESEENVFKTAFTSSNSENKDQTDIHRNEQLPLLLDSDHELSETETNVFKDTKLVMSSATVNEEVKKGKEFVLEGEGLDTFPKCNDKQSEKENKANAENKKSLEPSKSDFGLLLSNLSDHSYKCQSYTCNLDLSKKRKRKLISVIEDDVEQNLYHSKTQ